MGAGLFCMKLTLNHVYGFFLESVVNVFSILAVFTYGCTKLMDADSF